ncbi:MAG: HlyC/CorC family transporter [Pseudomonadota bacterium]
MNDPDSLTPLFIALGVLLVMSAFFSGTETALMALNRYRLRTKARAGHRGAQLAEKLLARPDRLIGLILLGNNVVNIAATTLTSVIAQRIGGEPAVAIGAGILTFVVLIFAEVAPKTLAALKADSVALPAAFVYYPLSIALYPFVWLINQIANGMLRLFGLTKDVGDGTALTREELRTAVAEAGALIPRRHRGMLLGILDLEKVSVEDVMIPRSEVIGLDLDDDWDEILAQIRSSRFTRMPVFHGRLNKIVGLLHLRKAVPYLARGELDVDSLVELAEEPYFVPEGTALYDQLLHFQSNRTRYGLVVDEYGDIQGLVTLQDILAEIVGEVQSAQAYATRDVHPQDDGSFVVNGSANVRALNRTMRWQLPTDGPKTINGLITETLETIPEPGTSLELAGYPVEIIQTSGNAIRTVRITAPSDNS